jgi:hypothetical protein
MLKYIPRILPFTYHEYRDSPDGWGYEQRHVMIIRWCGRQVWEKPWGKWHRPGPALVNGYPAEGQSPQPDGADRFLGIVFCAAVGYGIWILISGW